MEIRNLMEDRVLRIVNEICDEDDKVGLDRYCTNAQCRLDAMCFVLNRIPQKYVTSGRGFAHSEAEINENLQIDVDIVTLVHEGLQRVTSIQRSFYDDGDSAGINDLTGDFYYFIPTIKGRLFDSSTFSPASDIQISLYEKGKLVAQIDNRWSNPYHIVKNTPGTYIFWPHPVLAISEGEEEVFEFNIQIDHPQFELINHYFTVPVRSEEARAPKALIREFSVADIFLVKRGSQEMSYSVEDEGIIV